MIFALGAFDAACFQTLGWFLGRLSAAQNGKEIKARASALSMRVRGGSCVASAGCAQGMQVPMCVCSSIPYGQVLGSDSLYQQAWILSRSTAAVKKSVSVFACRNAHGGLLRRTCEGPCKQLWGCACKTLLTRVER